MLIAIRPLIFDSGFGFSMDIEIKGLDFYPGPCFSSRAFDYYMCCEKIRELREIK